MADTIPIQAPPIPNSLPDPFRLLFNISSEFIDMKSKNMDSAIEGHLKDIMRIFNLDRMALNRYEPEELRIRSTHSIVMDGIQPLPRDLVFTQEGVDKLRAGEELIFKNLRPDRPSLLDMPSFKRAEGIPIHSSIVIPLHQAGEFVGAFGFGTASRPLETSESTLSFMRHLAGVFARAFGRRLRDDRLEAAYYEINQLKQHLLNENTVLRQEIARTSPEIPIIGKNQAVKTLLSSIENVAPTRAGVLICGETGVGKELFAHKVHQSSPRRDKQMIIVNCGAIPSNLFESEFFGRRKGAYTSADDSMPGKFELAHGSTLFLDEVGELSLDAQAKLLRVLQEGVFERLGSTKPIKVDVRVIAATNCDLEKMVHQKLFRQDLFFRLNVFPLYVPALRERTEDIPALVWHFVHTFEKEFGKIINNIRPETMRKLQMYRWPGNIRELKNIIARAVINTPGETLEVLLPSSRPEQNSLALKDVEREHIRKVLETTNWRVGGAGNAAELLNINRTTLISRMKKLGLSKPST